MSFGQAVLDLGSGNTYSASPFASGSDWLDANYTNDAVFNLGVGYYWTQKFRTDITVESRRTQEVDIDGNQSVQLIGGGAVLGDSYAVSVDDHTLVRGAVFMVNGYYDFTQFGAFKPYIGGGIGFGYTDLERKNQTSICAFDASVGPGCISLANSSSRDRQQVTQTALAATVGFSYQLTDITDLDFGYRFLWVEGAHADLTVNGHGSSIEIDDTMEHQIRAGLRFNVF
jgi:opacity protein-like surface antigen